MPEENLQELTLEKLLDKMHVVMSDYIILQKQEDNFMAIFQKGKELEKIHEAIRARTTNYTSLPD